MVMKTEAMMKWKSIFPFFNVLICEASCCGKAFMTSLNAQVDIYASNKNNIFMQLSFNLDIIDSLSSLVLISLNVTLLLLVNGIKYSCYKNLWTITNNTYCRIN